MAETKIKHLLFLFIASALLFSACGDKPLFTELAGNRVKVIIKGTYASNNPPPWTNVFPLDVESTEGLNKGSIDDCITDEDHPEIVCPDTNEIPTAFMLDIAGIRVSTGKHHQYFADNRMTYKMPLTDDEPFFSGSGIVYKNDDVRPDFRWESVQMYIRKMIFNSATEYYEENVREWVFKRDLTVLFHEEDVPGFDFNQIQVNSYYDSLLNYSDEINRIFPLVIHVEDGFVFDNDEEETVLELRLVIKNFIKRYEYDFSDDYHYVKHFWALSDWLRNVYKDENNIGGNLLAVARSYVRGKTAALTGNAGSPGCYVVAVKSSHDISEYGITDGERQRPACDKPKGPDQAVPDDIINILDYYLKYETYKRNYDTFVDCVDSGDYETQWTDYETAISGYRIPPLATWTETGEFTLTEVPVDETYRLYRSTDGNGSAELPSSFEELPVDPVTVSEDDAGQTITVQ